jgi:hypothetical protein
MSSALAVAFILISFLWSWIWFAVYLNEMKKLEKNYIMRVNREQELEIALRDLLEVAKDVDYAPKQLEEAITNAEKLLEEKQ